MAGPKILFSFSFSRELNLHRSKEQLEREFAKMDTGEFQEFVSRFTKDIKKYLSSFGGVKSVDIPEQIYVVLRDRGLSFPEPLTVVYDENQKLMLVRYIYLLANRLFEKPEAAVLLTRAVASKLPLSVERELHELQGELHILVPLPYDLTEKPLKKWLK